ncbi:MAG: hypothetical protein EBT30_09255 [Verrucomicrobia bacterium]|nr:hypothetical protein [Verrucomicrobiota bacterium]
MTVLDRNREEIFCRDGCAFPLHNTQRGPRTKEDPIQGHLLMVLLFCGKSIVFWGGIRIPPRMQRDRGIKGLRG